jgi:hypothetical protein
VIRCVVALAVCFSAAVCAQIPLGGITGVGVAGPSFIASQWANASLSSSAQTETVNAPALPTVNNYVRVWCIGDGSAVNFTVTDNQGNSYSKLSGETAADTEQVADFQAKVVTSSGTFTPKCDVGAGNSTQITIIFAECQHCTGSLDGATNNPLQSGAAFNSDASGTMNTSHAVDLVTAACGTSSGQTNANYTAGTNSGGSGGGGSYAIPSNAIVNNGSSYASGAVEVFNATATGNFKGDMSVGNGSPGNVNCAQTAVY